MKTGLVIGALLLTCGPSALAQEKQAAAKATIASAVSGPFRVVEYQVLSAAEAMPEDKYSFVPTAGEFKGARTFAEQLKHVACANFGFFKQIEKEIPPPDCGTGGPHPAKTKAELLAYARESFAYAMSVIAKTDERNLLDEVTGRYGGPSTRLGIAVLAVWHGADHYGQLAEYLRMCGIVPPMSRANPPPLEKTP